MKEIRYQQQRQEKIPSEKSSQGFFPGVFFPQRCQVSVGLGLGSRGFFSRVIFS